jgi:Tol biopolymer transport system component
MRPRPVLILALAAAAAALLSAPALAAKDDVVLISRATGPAGAPVDAGAFEPSISASGAQVAFSSDADNISGEDDNAFRNVFVRDAATNVTTLASRATGAGGVAGDGFSLNASISADARFVAFESVADNLSPDDNAFTNIFVRDLVTNTTTLVSRRTGPAGAGANDNSFQPDISGDGRYVVFQSDANNLSRADNNAFTNIFVRDLVANTTTLVSRRPGPGGAGANDNSIDATISADGNRVAFSSGANNLSNEDDDAEQNIFVRDLATATNALVSRASGAGGAPGNGESESADISSSGRFVAFRSDADNLSGEDVNTEINIFVRDLDQSTTALASRNRPRRVRG